MAEFQYHMVELIKTAVLGSGSYGVVCKAKCDDLQCAAKLLHNALFKVNDPGAVTLIRRFEQECQFLNGIKHPHIIQYLGIQCDPDSGLPVLLMELAEENLTRYLERSHEHLPYFMQVNICQGVALALAYLHSNDIIHRDLSSNNVLMVGNKAKISDFGMSKLVSVDPRITPLTMCPGATVYMPPEALKEPPMYNKKLDCFSFGVLTIQVLTRQFPDPGLRFRSIEIQDARIPMGRVDVPIPEAERRYPHISLIDPNHPLLPTALQCLKDDDRERPSAHEICQCLSELKKNLKYTESLAQHISPDYQRRICELEQQNEHQSIRIQLLQSDLLAKNHLLGEKSEAMRARLQEIQQLTHQFQELQCTVDAREKQLRELNQTHEQLISSLEQRILQKDERIHSLEQEKQQQLGKLPNADGTIRRATIIKLKWEKEGGKAKNYLIGGSSVSSGNISYFYSSSTSEEICAYDLDSQAWTSLSSYPYPQFTLAVVNNLLTGIGGWNGGVMNQLLSLTGRGPSKKWTKHFPPMPTKRYDAVAACAMKTLVVAGGGCDGRILPTVDIMNTETNQWFTAESLPHSLVNDLSSLVICGDHIYSLGGVIDNYGQDLSRLVWRCSLGELNELSRPVMAAQPDTQTVATRLKKAFGLRHEVPAVEVPTPDRNKVDTECRLWQSVAETPLFGSAYASVGGQLLAIGGTAEDNGRDCTHSADVYAYDPESNTWKATNRMLTPRSNCLAAVLPNDTLLVVGGRTNGAVPYKALKDMEIATVI